jgi:hypothetical protein
VSRPLDALGPAAGAHLETIEAFSSLRAGETGVSEPIDLVQLPSFTIPSPRVELGTGEPGDSETEIAFATRADLDRGTFRARIEELPPTHTMVWIRGCLGELCGSASSVPIPS